MLVFLFLYVLFDRLGFVYKRDKDNNKNEGEWVLVASMYILSRVKAMLLGLMDKTLLVKHCLKAFFVDVSCFWKYENAGFF